MDRQLQQQEVPKAHKRRHHRVHRRRRHKDLTNGSSSSGAQRVGVINPQPAPSGLPTPFQQQQQHRQGKPGAKGEAAVQAGFSSTEALKVAGVVTPDMTSFLNQLQRLLCPQSSTGSSADSSSTGPAADFSCINCLTADDLTVIEAAEAELARAGRFVAVYDVLLAYQLNSRAVGQPGPAPTTTPAATAASTSIHNTGTSSTSNALTAVPAAAGDAGVSQQQQIDGDKVQGTLQVVSPEGLSLADLNITQYYTTASQLTVTQKLAFNRRDYVMSAWMRARQEVECAGAAVRPLLLSSASSSSRGGGDGEGGGSRDLDNSRSWRGGSAAADGGGAGGQLSAGCVVRRLQAVVGKCLLNH
jgi:hypothetical protein